jgi:hypothetical protein
LGEPGCHEGDRSGLAGTPLGNYAAAVRFFGETLDLEVAFDAGNTVELAAGNGDRIQLPGPGHRSFEFYRSHGDSTVPLLEVDHLDQARPSGPAAAPSYSAGRSQTAPGPGSPSGRPAGTSTAWAPAWRSWQARRLWSNALDMRQIRMFTPKRGAEHTGQANRALGHNRAVSHTKPRDKRAPTRPICVEMPLR